METDLQSVTETNTQPAPSGGASVVAANDAVAAVAAPANESGPIAPTAYESVTRGIAPQQAANDTQHTKMQSSQAPTSDYVRILLLVLTLRKGVEGTVHALYDEHAPDWWKNGIDKGLDHFATNGVIKELDQILLTHPLHELKDLAANGMSDEAVAKVLAETDNGKLVAQKFEKVLQRWRANGADHIEEAVRYAYEKGMHEGVPHITTTERKGSKGDIRNSVRTHATNLTYDYALGLGSLALTYTYTHYVYSDIKNLFCESVGMEMGKPADQVSFFDIMHSDNRLIKQTVKNFMTKAFERFGSDALFFIRPIPLFRNLPVGDIMVGVKGLMALGDTWKRKTTMFEDLVSFVNNKINPRNGLGQPIGMGEVFDLYQHYSDAFNHSNMFTNVIERSQKEGVQWSQSQPIFQRITELMNLTYAYKHSSMLDPKTGHPVQQADFPLPKFIYLLGHDLIDVDKPEQTRATIEIANRYGIPAVKEMQVMLNSGKSLNEITARFPVAAHPAPPSAEIKKPVASEKNTVIAKGSTIQLDQADGIPQTANVNVAGIEHSMLETPAQLNHAIV